MKTFIKVENVGGNWKRIKGIQQTYGNEISVNTIKYLFFEVPYLTFGSIFLGRKIPEFNIKTKEIIETKDIVIQINT